MRTQTPEADVAVDAYAVVDWRSEFVPAIIAPAPQIAGCGSLSRSPSWFVAKFDHGSAKTMIRVLDLIGIRFHLFRYTFRRPRAKPTERYWFPGYVFLNFDIQRDRWHQLRRVPGLINILGDRTDRPAPIDDEIMADLMVRLPPDLPKGTSTAIFRPGVIVRISKGALSGLEGVVVESDRKIVTITSWMFGRPTLSRIPTPNVTLIG